MLKDLTYKVIVIDDEVDLYEDYVEFIEAKLKNEGYLLEHKRFEELSDLDDNPLNDVDLFLVDLKFGKIDKGPEFIKKIRENYLTDILFYSSDSKAIQNSRVSGKYQGVFFAIRDENKNEILKMIDQLINKMIKRSNTPLSARGIVLGCVAEIDNIVKSKVESLLLQINKEQYKQLINNCTKMYYDSNKGQAKNISDFFGCEFHNGIKNWDDVKTGYTEYNLNELVQNIKITDSNKNFRILLNIYKKLFGKDNKYSEIKNFKELLDERNIFAHEQEQLNENNYYQFKNLNDDNFLVLSEEKCKELRISIIEYCTYMSEIDK